MTSENKINTEMITPTTSINEETKTVFPAAITNANTLLLTSIPPTGTIQTTIITLLRIPVIRTTLAISISTKMNFFKITMSTTSMNKENSETEQLVRSANKKMITGSPTAATKTATTVLLTTTSSSTKGTEMMTSSSTTLTSNETTTTEPPTAQIPTIITLDEKSSLTTAIPTAAVNQETEIKSLAISPGANTLTSMKTTMQPAKKIKNHSKFSIQNNNNNSVNNKSISSDKSYTNCIFHRKKYLCINSINDVNK